MLAYCCRNWSAAAILLVLILLPVGLLAQRAGDTVIVRDAAGEDLYLAGETVRVLADVDGDVVAAGGTVSIDRLVTGDVLAAGGEVTIRGTTRDDVRLAGGQVFIAGSVGDDAVAAGGSVILAAGASVGGRAWFAGGDVRVQGDVERELRVRGERVRISGRVRGDVEVMARHIEILPQARIDGDFLYRAEGEPQIDPQAQIAGQRIALPGAPPGFSGPVYKTGAGIIALLGVMVAAIALYLLFPGFSLEAARRVGANPLKSAFLGLALIVTTPVAGIILLASAVGGLLAVLLMLGYGTMLIAGTLTGFVYIADAAARWLGARAEAGKGRRVLAIALAVVAVGALQWVPVLGGLTVLFLVLFGVGALMLQGYSVYASSGA